MVESVFSELLRIEVGQMAGKLSHDVKFLLNTGLPFR